jgi:hypothetical protein
MRLNNGDDLNLRMGVIESLRTIVIAILIVLLTIILVGASLGVIINNTILESTFLIRSLKGQQAYAQIRQLMFRMVNRSLPNGRESIPYLEKVLSESWLEKEVNTLIRGIYAFAKGKWEQTPTISFHNLKKQVADSLDDDRSYQERTRLVQFWFDPLPDEVRLEDFMSLDFIWSLRRAVSFMSWLPWIICGVGFIMILLLYLVLLDWKQVFLWFGSAAIAAGALLILLGLMIGWITGRMSIVINTVDSILSYGIPETSVDNFLKALISGITKPINIAGMLSILIGGAFVYFTPIHEKNLFLVK